MRPTLSAVSRESTQLSVYYLLPLDATLLHTGTLVLTRGDDGLITKYREIWDVTVAESLKTVYL